MNNTGSIFSELRKEAGYTQKELAQKLNITDKAISKWERGICLPDVSLLSKLSLLLDADIELMLNSNNKRDNEDWVGVLDLSNSNVDLSQIIYDKPMVYYLLSHYLLLSIKDIYVITDEHNKKYLKSDAFSELGINFIINSLDLPKKNLMIMNSPCFLFGSDLTRQFQGAMLTEDITKVVPINSPVPFLFCPAEYSFMYMKNPQYLIDNATEKNLGRGMVCINMDNPDSIDDVSSFVRMYQKNTGLKIGDITEISNSNK